jgi:hypothetical protein
MESPSSLNTADVSAVKVPRSLRGKFVIAAIFQALVWFNTLTRSVTRDGCVWFGSDPELALRPNDLLALRISTLVCNRQPLPVLMARTSVNSSCSPSRVLASA